MDLRQQNKTRAYRGTCRWITRHRVYKDWLEEGSGILWIKGKPGSGKSTLMAFFLDDFKSQRICQESILICFFFHGRGTSLQKSRLGMYRSLLHQLLDQSPQIECELFRAFQKRTKTRGTPGQHWEWQANELCEFFHDAVRSVAREQTVSIFIDALDEASDGDDDHVTRYQILQNFHYLNDTLTRDQLRSAIIFSSRHRPVPAHNSAYEIYVENENKRDIQNFVQGRLSEVSFRYSIERTDLAEIENTITRGATGVFQWAALVVDLVNRYQAEGESPNQIVALIQRLPKQLAEIYEYILKNVVEERHREKSIRLLRLIHLAEEPLTISDMYCAMNIHDSDGGVTTLPQLEADTTVLPRMKELIVTWSGGLAEIVTEGAEDMSSRDSVNSYDSTASDNPNAMYCQFIHQSVSDFFHDGGFRTFNPEELNDEIIIGQGHLQISLICANYLNTINLEHYGRYDRDHMNKNFPFLNYAANFWFQHASQAEARGVSSLYLVDYSQKFPKLVESWRTICGLLSISHNGINELPVAKSMLYVASRFGLTSIVRSLLSSRSIIEEENSSGGRALYLASLGGTEKIVQILLEGGANIHSSEGFYGTPLAAAALGGHQETVRSLLNAGADTNAQGGWYGTALQAAAESEMVEIVRSLLEKGAYINAQGGHYGNALQAAAARKNLEIVRLLLEKGADINAQGGESGNTLLAATAYTRNLEIVHLLHEKGADINAQGGEFGTALQAAAAISGNIEIVRLLLEKGADINAQGGYYGTALQAAAANFRGNLEMVHLLLEKGADVNTQGGEFGNALNAARSRNNKEIENLLLAHGAVELDHDMVHDSGV